MATITRRGQTQLRQMESTEQGIVAKSGMYPSSDPETENESEDSQENLLDIDVRNIDKPEKLARYAETIFTLTPNEIETSIASSQDKLLLLWNEITPSMYEIAVRWLFEIQEQYPMLSDTLFTAVGVPEYLNTVLLRQTVSRAKIQLVTVTCIWMASNVEERSVPKTDELCTMCSKDYTADDFINCEKELAPDMSGLPAHFSNIEAVCAKNAGCD